MDRIFMENFRCFRKPQSARLAPLTLLVGENSTGKTSFLALVRALWRVAFQNEVPDFREEPYDLGTFSETVHDRGGRSKQPESFRAGIEYTDSNQVLAHDVTGMSFEVSFENRHGFPFPVLRRLATGNDWLEVDGPEGDMPDVKFGSRQETWELKSASSRPVYDPVPVRLEPVLSMLSIVGHVVDNENGQATLYLGMASSGTPYEGTLTRLKDVFFGTNSPFGYSFAGPDHRLPFAGAPVRSRPLRTYDPTRPRPDPEGEYIPTYLASLSQRDKEKWDFLKSALENFGQAAGLFDEISIKLLGLTEGTPFQIQVRKFGGRVKGPWRNLIDVGYGVSQTLPVLAELLDSESAPLFLLQQPEVHLHPSAQAALGSLFCSVAGPERQLIVETHSDYLLDRVRMDVRDKKTDLKPEDVSILYFERDGLEVNIHSLRLDEMGNVLDAPPGYRQFFMDEVTRSIGL